MAETTPDAPLPKSPADVLPRIAAVQDDPAATLALLEHYFTVRLEEAPAALHNDLLALGHLTRILRTMATATPAPAPEAGPEPAASTGGKGGKKADRSPFPEPASVTATGGDKPAASTGGDAKSTA